MRSPARGAAWLICLTLVPLLLAQPPGPASHEASLGLDPGLWEGVRNRTPLEAADRRAFYQVLQAVGRFTPRELLEQAGEPTPLAPLFNDPDQQFGRLVNLEGVVRRVTQIRVEDAELRKAYGFDHYFQVELFPVDSQNNPLVCCLRTVPGGRAQPRLHETWQVPGVFFKVWAYHPQSGAASKVRLAPLIIGPGALRVTILPADRSEWTWIALGVLALVALGAGAAIQWRRAEHAAHRRRVGHDDAAPRAT